MCCLCYHFLALAKRKKNLPPPNQKFEDVCQILLAKVLWDEMLRKTIMWLQEKTPKNIGLVITFVMSD